MPARVRRAAGATDANSADRMATMAMAGQGTPSCRGVFRNSVRCSVKDHATPVPMHTPMKDAASTSTRASCTYTRTMANRLP